MEASADLAYVLGVLKSDGWVAKNHVIGLNAKDHPFVDAFGRALGTILGRNLEPRIYQFRYGPQWRVTVGRKTFADWLRVLTWPDIESLIAGYEGAFIRGVYDSEGTLFVRKRGPNSYQPIYRIYGIKMEFLHFCHDLLTRHGISARMELAGPIGQKTVGDTVRLHDLYCLLWVGHTNSRLWESWAGTNIDRKRYTGPSVSPIRCPRKYRVL